MDSKTHNLTSYGGAFLEWILLYYIYNITLTSHQSVIFCCWLAHFAKRTLESAFVHKYSNNKPIEIFDFIGEYIYYWGFGYWIFASVTSSVKEFSTFTIIGLCLWIAGELINLISHFKLANIRAKESNKRGIPRGFLFELVSCPHYFGEILSWIGFTIASQTVPSVIFTLATTGILFTWGKGKHDQYLKEFKGTYPANRKILIPFVY